MAAVRTPLTLVLALGIAALASGCRRSPAPGTAPSTSRGGELVASLRSEPSNYIRYFDPKAPSDLVALLTQARLVRVNRATDAVEPALSDSWTASDDGRTVTMHLREGVAFSDGAPFTSADVMFSFAAAYDAPGSFMAQALTAGGSRLEVSAPDPHTVVVRFPVPFAPGVRLLDNLPILPRHKLEAAFRAGTMHEAWVPGKPLDDVVGLGPFVLSGHVAGQRLVFSRNPRYWRRADDGTPLPYLDRLTVEIVPEQNAEALRLESGATDLMANGDIRPEDYARFKRLADQGRLRLVDIGVGLDPTLLWFNLKTPSGKDGRPWIRRKEFRQALSYGADRQAIANSVYFGAAVPVYGPITPRNTTWFSAAAPAYEHDPARARTLLAAAGLTDRNGDGLLEDAAGVPVRFSLLVQQGVPVRERTVSVLQEQFRRLGVGVDVVGLDPGALMQRWQAGDYDAIFHAFQSSATDPAMNLDFWTSSGSMHVWNPGQPAPGTAWEAKIDRLMHEQAAAQSLAERQRLFAEVQRLLGDEVPAIYLVAPRVTIALAPRVAGAVPAAQAPQVLWCAETLAAAAPR